MNYDRRRQAALPRLDQVLHRPAEADEAMGQAYRALISFKSGFDSMEEIPSNLHGLYGDVMKAMDAVVSARKHTAQVREMTKRLPR